MKSGHASRAILDHIMIRVLVIIVLCLLAANAFFILFYDELIAIPRSAGFIVKQLDLSNEGNFATWFSSILLLLNSLYAYDQARHNWSFNRSVARTCIILSIGFLFLSIDDIIMFHERLERFATKLLMDFGISGGLDMNIGYLFGGILGIILIILVTGSYFRSIKRENYLFLLCSIAFVIIAGLSEFVYDHWSWFDPKYIFRIEVFFEEGSEFGAILSFLIFQHREAVALEE
jgi:hypothetical protein